MNPHIPHSKLQQIAQEQTTTHQQAQQEQTLEFATAEEVIRHDATQVRVPPSVTQRLQRSLAAEPCPSRSWWRRWLRPPER